MNRLSGPKEIRLPVSVYGKLPFYKEFLRASLASKEAQALKQWLDRGISHYWSANKLYSSHTIGPHGFFLRFPGTGKQVIGCLWGSHDEGYLRFFPFTIFVSLPAGRGPIPTPSSIDVLAQIVEHASRIRDDLGRMLSVEHFNSWSRDLSVPLTIRPETLVKSRLAEELALWSVDQFATTLYDDQAETHWPALLSYIERHQELARSAVHGVSLAARLPSCDAGPSIMQQVHIWCSLLRNGASRRDAAVNLFVPLEDSQQGIIVLQRRLRTDDIYVLHPQMPEYDFIEDLRTRVPREKSSPSETFLGRSLNAMIGLAEMSGNQSNGD
jgi:type VI secretion system ImpM family protein